MSEDLEQVRRHLEFLGYETTDEGEGRIAAKHASKPNFVARDFHGGCLLSAYFKAAPPALQNRAAYLEAINSINAPATIARFYADSDSDLAMEAFYSFPYERSAFGHFMELWDQDFIRVLTSDIPKFLS